GLGAVGGTGTPGVLVGRLSQVVQDSPGWLSSGAIFQTCPRVMVVIRQLGSTIGNSRSARSQTAVGSMNSPRFDGGLPPSSRRGLQRPGSGAPACQAPLRPA